MAYGIWGNWICITLANGLSSNNVPFRSHTQHVYWKHIASAFRAGAISSLTFAIYFFLSIRIEFIHSYCSKQFAWKWMCVCVLGQAHRHSYVLCGFGFQTAPNICLKCIHTDICPSFSVFSLEFFLKFYFVGFSFSCACLFVCLFWACISRVWCFFALTKNPVATFSSKCSILFCSALFCSMHIAHT